MAFTSLASVASQSLSTAEQPFERQHATRDVEPISRQGMSSGEPDFKQLGNEEFRNGAYLKAAALYTKGLKLYPGNAVLLRSVPDELACAYVCGS